MRFDPDADSDRGALTEALNAVLHHLDRCHWLGQRLYGDAPADHPARRSLEIIAGAREDVAFVMRWATAVPAPAA
jgi:hypothetical protein